MKYITAIFLALSVIFGFLAYYYHNRADSYCELWKNSEANNTYLIKQREKDYADTLEISRKAKEIEEAAKMDKSVFNWDYDISHTNVVLRLQSK